MVDDGCRRCFRGEIANQLRRPGYNSGICKAKWMNIKQIPPEYRKEPLGDVVLGRVWSSLFARKKRITEVLAFRDYIEEVYDAYEQHKLETVDTVRAGKCTNAAEMTEEEALAEQQRMFAEARARMNGVAAAPKPPEAEPSLNRNVKVGIHILAATKS